MKYLYVIYRWRKLILLNAILVGFISSIIVLFLPKWYKAETVLAPPKQDFSLLTGFSQMFSNIPLSRTLGLRSASEETDLCITILNSRTIMECIVKKYRLQKLYKKRNMEDAVHYLRKNVDFIVEDEGAIRIKVLDKSPDQAAAMANDFVFFLDSLFNHLLTQKAKNNRVFIEKRLSETKLDMEKAEEALQLYQQKYNIISLEGQTKAIVEIFSELQARLLANRFELALKESIFGSNFSDVQRLNEEIVAMEKELEKLKYGENNYSHGKIVKREDNKNIIVPISEMPKIALTYLNLYKEVQVQNKLYLLLMQEYEQAKIQELKDTPIIQVIDKAIPPIKKCKPKRFIIVFSCIFSCTIIFSSIIFLFETFSFSKYKKH